MQIHPEALICTQLKSCTLTNFWFRSKFVTRHCTAVIFQTPVYLDNYPALNRHCNATRVMLTKFCTWTAKSALPSHYARRDTAYPPCTVTTSRLKYQDSARMLRRVTLLVPHSGNLPILPGRYKQAMELTEIN
jgi:hypothetical protein